MTRTHHTPETLRQRVQALLREQTEQPPAAARSLVYKLVLRQLEIERQNEELQRAQLELSAERARYFDLYDLAPVGYASMTEAGLIVQANLQLASLLGVVRSALVNQPINHFICGEDQDRFARLRQQLLKTSARQSCELRMLRSDGTLFWAQLTATVTRETAPMLRVMLADVSKRKQAEEQLHQLTSNLEQQVRLRTQRLRELSMQMTMTEERERRLLAQELHDNLCQLLAVVKIKLTSFVPGSPEPAIDQAVALVDQALQSARVITRQLSPPILHTLGLLAALEGLAEDVQRMHDLDVHTEFETLPELPVEAVQAVLYRSVRELLMNVVRHAKVKEVRLACRCQQHRLMLVVSDQGRGFDAADFPASLPGSQGFGLSSIYERIANIGGEMQINSNPGKGTTVTLNLPLGRVANEVQSATG